ncbi:tripartite tricarboxylate transporter substrate binding protein [soil metagenome]
MSTRSRPATRIILTAIACVLALCGGAAQAQTYPTKPIRLVVPFPAGTGADLSARRVAQSMASILNQAIVVENRAGAGGAVGSDFVARAPADGYTLLAGTLNTHAMNPWLYRNLPYDPVRDFVPITRITTFPNVLVVPSSLKVNTLAELVALAKQRKDRPLTFGSGGVGTTAQLSAELLKQTVGIEALHIPYQGTSQAMADVLAGRVDMIFGNIPVVLPHIKSGALHALAITSLTRSPLLPDVPTVEELGIKSAEISVWIALFAPKGTPPDIVNAISRTALAALDKPEVQQGFAQDGADPVRDATSADFARVLKADIDRWGKVVKASGVTPE